MLLESFEIKTERAPPTTVKICIEYLAVPGISELNAILDPSAEEVGYLESRVSFTITVLLLPSILIRSILWTVSPKSVAA